MQKPRRSRLVIALTLSGMCLATVMVAQETTLTKPLNQFTIGDVFPGVVTESFAETGKSWKKAANELTRLATARKQSVAAALSIKKAELPNTKRQLKLAKQEKDLAKIGALEGTFKNEALIVEILKGLENLSDDQIALAAAWKEAGSAMEKYTAADEEFEPYRARLIVRPEAGEVDQRLGADGYQAFKSHATAMKELGEAYSELGSRTESLANDRVKLLASLEKGGHVQAPK